MSEEKTIRFLLNGAPVKARVSANDTLIDVLQDTFDLKGARESCGQGLCGCCTVFMDGKAVSSCLTLAWFADGTKIETVEGLADGDQLTIVQQAFIDSGAFQCGFCTPGFIMMTTKLLAQDSDPSEEHIRHFLTGNLCRCSAYPEIIDAVKLAAARQRLAAE